MSKSRKRQPFPKPWHHRPSGRACVTLRVGGRRQDVYLGPWGSPEASAAYRRLVAAHEHGTAVAAACRGLPDLTVAEMLEAWIDAVERRPNGAPELANSRGLITLLLDMYGPTQANGFGPKDLRLVRDELVRRGRARTGINREMVRLRTVWRWAASQELVQVDRVAAMSMVRGLRMGESAAREPGPVVAVQWADVEPVLEHLSSVVRAMVLVAWHTGARPGEVCKLRPCDLDFNGPDRTWIATIGDHKTKHVDPRRARYLALGRAAQDAVRPHLANRRVDAPVFSPQEAVAEHLARREAERRTPANAGNRPGTNRVDRPRRAPGDRFTSVSFARAVARGCERAFGEEGRHRWWTPNQLRHAFASRVREHLGLVEASEALGHTTAEITARNYAERSKAAAVRAAIAVGG